MIKKILLADDSITIRKVVGIIFAVEDYQLLTAGDGDSAYETATTEKPDLVIADISMPGKNGFELCRAVKSNPDLAMTSVLLLTGAFESFDEDRAAEVAADGWLIKPFESQVLLDKVNQLLAGTPQRLAASDETEDFVMPEEEDFFSGDPATADKQDLPDTPETEEMSISDDDDIWGEVSFADEDLKPQDLLASTDEDVPEEEPDEEPFADLDLSDEDELPTEVNRSTEDIGDVDDRSEDLLSADDFDADADADELIEVMEDDLTEEDTLVEDEQTFIGHKEDQQDHFGVPEDEDEDVLDLTESDVIAPDSNVDKPSWFGEDEEELPFVDDETEDKAEEEPLSSVAAEDQDDFAGFTFQGDDEQEDDEEPDFAFVATEDADEGDEDVSAVEDEQDFTFVAEPETLTDTLPDETTEQILNRDEVAEVAREEPQEETPFVTPFVPEQEDSFGAAQEVDPVFADDQTVDQSNDQTSDEASDQTADKEPASQQLEDQLAALSEEELKQIVERVAGPLIEKLAKEMLERVVWEVVPDLAETMISAEIAKIKQDNG